jgi:hypothetical protein
MMQAKDRSKMTLHSGAARITILAAGSAFALLMAALGDHAHAESKLDATFTISFARIRVGDITATFVVGDSEYAITAQGRAGGIMAKPPSPRAASSRAIIRRRQALPPKLSPMPEPRM